MKDFLKKYWFVLLSMLLILIGTYLWFIAQGVFPVGTNLEKGDWLSFWGGFLSFGGSTILGAVAVWQNNRANDVNEKAIAENRRMDEIEFEHSLKREEYTLIIRGIQQINQQIFNVIQTLNSTLKQPTPSVTDYFLQSVVMDINCIRCMGVDSALPPCYDEKYPILKKGKEAIKNTLAEYEKEIKQSIEEKDDKDKEYHISISFPQETMLELSSFFHNKLNSIQSYRSFSEGGLLDEQ